MYKVLKIILSHLLILCHLGIYFLIESFFPSSSFRPYIRIGHPLFCHRFFSIIPQSGMNLLYHPTDDCLSIRLTMEHEMWEEVTVPFPSSHFRPKRHWSVAHSFALLLMLEVLSLWSLLPLTMGLRMHIWMRSEECTVKTSPFSSAA